MTGKVKGCSIVDRQRARLALREALPQGVDQAGQEVGCDPGIPAVVDHLGQSPPKEHLPPLSGPSLGRDRDLRQPQKRQHPRLGEAFDRRGDMRHRRFRDQPRVAAEQGERDHRHRRPRRFGRHIAPFPISPPRRCFPRRLDEHRPLRFDRGGRKAGRDNLALLAPQFAIGGQQPAADDRIEQGFDDIGLYVVRRIIEQDMANQVGVEQDVDSKAKDVALQIVDLEGAFGPAKD